MIEQTPEQLIQRAKEIAVVAHQGQTRTDGRPYIEHPCRVANAVEDRLKPIAYLHDVIEDTSVTLDDLLSKGFPDYVISAIDVLTHRTEDTNIQYWAKIKTNPDALSVKLADINDNVNDHPLERAKAKYVLALKFFSEP